MSNLAWDPAGEDEAVAALFGRKGISGVELAPTKVWATPTETPRAELLRYREFWNQRGVAVVAMQALLFGRPEFALFGSDEDRRRLGEYLARIIELGGALGAHALVFGSPRNRRRGEMAPARALDIAAEFFQRMGAVAEENGTALCIEPNPPEYGCDFVTTVAEGAELVSRVGRRGFGLHLDAGGMTLNQEDPGVEITRAGAGVRHFHISEPNLAPVGDGGTDHAAMARALRGAGYGGWASIEMRPAGNSGNLPHVERALQASLASYGVTQVPVPTPSAHTSSS